MSNKPAPKSRERERERERERLYYESMSITWGPGRGPEPDTQVHKEPDTQSVKAHRTATPTAIKSPSIRLGARLCLHRSRDSARSLPLSPGRARVCWPDSPQMLAPNVSGVRPPSPSQAGNKALRARDSILFFKFVVSNSHPGRQDQVSVPSLSPSLPLPPSRCALFQPRCIHITRGNVGHVEPAVLGVFGVRRGVLPVKDLLGLRLVLIAACSCTQARTRAGAPHASWNQCRTKTTAPQRLPASAHVKHGHERKATCFSVHSTKSSIEASSTSILPTASAIRAARIW